jgi:hypothetical protein
MTTVLRTLKKLATPALVLALCTSGAIALAGPGSGNGDHGGLLSKSNFPEGTDDFHALESLYKTGTAPTQDRLVHGDWRFGDKFWYVADSSKTSASPSSTAALATKLIQKSGSLRGEILEFRLVNRGPLHPILQACVELNASYNACTSNTQEEIDINKDPLNLKFSSGVYEDFDLKLSGDYLIGIQKAENGVCPEYHEFSPKMIPVDGICQIFFITDVAHAK